MKGVSGSEEEKYRKRGEGERSRRGQEERGKTDKGGIARVGRRGERESTRKNV